MAACVGIKYPSGSAATRLRAKEDWPSRDRRSAVRLASNVLILTLLSKSPLLIHSVMTPEQLHLLADTVRQNLLNSIDYEVNRAAESLGLQEEINDDDWQNLIDMIFS